MSSLRHLAIPVLLLLLAACGQRHELMLQQLVELERQNVADSVMTNDSLAEAQDFDAFILSIY